MRTALLLTFPIWANIISIIECVQLEGRNYQQSENDRQDAADLAPDYDDESYDDYDYSLDMHHMELSWLSARKTANRGRLGQLRSQPPQSVESNPPVQTSSSIQMTAEKQLSVSSSIIVKDNSRSGKTIVEHDEQKTSAVSSVVKRQETKSISPKKFLSIDNKTTNDKNSNLEQKENQELVTKDLPVLKQKPANAMEESIDNDVADVTVEENA